MNLDEKLIQCGIRPLRTEYSPLSLEAVKRIEKDVGPFPSAYREFVMRYGGALFDMEVHFMPKDVRFLKLSPEGWGTLDCFYGAVYGDDPWDPNSLQANIETFKGRSMPDSMIPIAASGHDHVCLGLRGADREKVFYWDRDDKPRADYNNVYLIADSFGEFLSSLICEDG